jgi:transcriptional regulator with XRE-family HTH domain
MSNSPFGQHLRHWRQQRGLSQMSLAALAEVSTRHLSWLETGRAEPSRAMVLRLAEKLDVPLRERNVLLLAAGYAALYTDKPLAHPQQAAARAALQRLLDAHMPWPALAMDRQWNLVASNNMVPLLLGSLSGLTPQLLQPPINVLRLSLHPKGLAPLIHNLPAWREHLLARLQRQMVSTGYAELRALWHELQAMPLPSGSRASAGTNDQAEQTTLEDVAAPLTLGTPWGILNFITTITVFGSPHDVVMSELAIETLLPADEATATTLRQLKTHGPAGAGPY